MPSDEPYIPPFVRRAMQGATHAELLVATDNLRRYLKLMRRLHQALEAKKAHADSHDRQRDVRFQEGVHQPPHP
jgi:hypothetical protein